MLHSPSLSSAVSFLTIELREGRIGERRGVYRVWVEKRERKRPLGRPRRRW
jgi:hypothetical protein